MTPDDFRKMALGIPTAVELAHMNHPDFRIVGKVFASLGAPDKDGGMVKLTPEQQRSFIKQAPSVFKPCSDAWGRSGCTNVHLASAEKGVLHGAFEAASKNVVSPAKKRKA